MNPRSRKARVQKGVKAVRRRHRRTWLLEDVNIDAEYIVISSGSEMPCDVDQHCFDAFCYISMRHGRLGLSYHADDYVNSARLFHDKWQGEIQIHLVFEESSCETRLIVSLADGGKDDVTWIYHPIDDLKSYVYNDIANFLKHKVRRKR